MRGTGKQKQGYKAQSQTYPDGSFPSQYGFPAVRERTRSRLHESTEKKSGQCQQSKQCSLAISACILADLQGKDQCIYSIEEEAERQPENVDSQE